MNKVMTGNFGQSVTKHRHIPDVLKSPDGNVLLLRAYDRGVKKYDWPASVTSKAAPRAILFVPELEHSWAVGSAPDAKYSTSKATGASCSQVTAPLLLTGKEI